MSQLERGYKLPSLELLASLVAYYPSDGLNLLAALGIQIDG
jgi:hypothetical protein